MAKPTRTFSGNVGDPSMGVAGPDQIEYDLDNAFAMFDPSAHLKDGSDGGVGTVNLQADIAAILTAVSNYLTHVHAGAAGDPPPVAKLANDAVRADGSTLWDSSNHKIYDSGWFAVAKGAGYVKTHGLGAIPRLIQVYFSSSVDGSNAEMCHHMYYYANGSQTKGIYVKGITATQFRVQAGSDDVHVGFDDAGNHVFYASGYCRVVAVK